MGVVSSSNTFPVITPEQYPRVLVNSAFKDADHWPDTGYGQMSFKSIPGACTYQNSRLELSRLVLTLRPPPAGGGSFNCKATVRFKPKIWQLTLTMRCFSSSVLLGEP